MPQRATSSIIKFDRDKLRAAIRKLGDEYVFYLLDSRSTSCRNPNWQISWASTSM